jgi:hypothetical protein
MKRVKHLSAIMIFLMAGLIALPCMATAKTVTVGTGSGAYGDTVSVPISVDDPAGIGGVAFTLTYDQNVFEFLGLEQVEKVISNGDEYKVAGTDPPEYNVADDQKEALSNKLFYQFNNEPDAKRVLVAGASATELTQATLFNAKFKIKETPAAGANGEYLIGLKPTIIENSAAGYASPTIIPVLVGMPAMTANDQGFFETPVFEAILVGGSITVNPPAASLFDISGAVTYQGGAAAVNGTPVVLRKKDDTGAYVFLANTVVNNGTYSFADNVAGDYQVSVRSTDPNFYGSTIEILSLSADKADADVVLPAPVRISGNLQINGGYLPGLSVKIMDGDTVVGIFPVNPDGTYRSGPLPPDKTYTKYAVYGSLTSATALDEDEDWTVSLNSISGTVSGLPGGITATVSAVSEAGMITATATTGDDGAYTIANLVPADDYVVSVTASDLPVFYFDAQTDVTQATPVDISSASQTGVDFSYTSASKGTISGTVTDGTGPAVGADVYAFEVNSYALVSVATGSDGSYALTLSPGIYELFVIKSNGVLFYYDAESEHHVTQSETKADGLEVTTDSALTDKDMNVVECDKTLAGKVTYNSETGEPVPFALILADSGDKRASTITRPDGTYTLSGLCEGATYTVAMDPQIGDYGIQSDTVVAGTDSTLNFIIDKGWVLSGTVKDSVSNAGISDAMIALIDQETQDLVGKRMYFSGKEGAYAIRDIPTGIYTLMASHPLYRSFTEADFPIAQNTVENIAMVKGANFNGKATDAAGKALQGVLIIVTRPNATPVYAMTKADGTYAIYGLDDTMSDYTLLAQKKGYEREVVVNQTPVSGAGTTVNFTLKKPAALFDLSGTISSSCDGNPPVVNALVVVSCDISGKTFFSSTRTGSDGSYSFKDLPQDDAYQFMVVPTGGLQVYVEDPMAVSEGSIASGSAKNDVALPCGNKISGTVTWSGNGPAYVLLYTDANGFVDFTTVADSGGTYAFSGLADGNYKVLAFVTGGALEWYDSQSSIGSADPVTAGGTADINMTD